MLAADCHTRLLGSLHRCSGAIGAAESLDDLLTVITDAIAEQALYQRVLVFRNRSVDNVPGAVAVAEWVASGVPPQATLSGEGWFPHAMWPEFSGPITAGSSTCIVLRRGTEPTRALFAKLRIQTLIGVPIQFATHGWGALVVQDCERERAAFPGEIELLNAFASIAASAIARRADEALGPPGPMPPTSFAERMMTEVAQITRRLLTERDTPVAIRAALRDVARVTACDRTCLMVERSTESGAMAHVVDAEWHADDVPSQQEDVVGQAVPNTMIPSGVLQQLYSGAAWFIEIDDRDDPFFQLQRSLAVTLTGAVSLIVDGAYYGCIAFDICRPGVKWAPEQIRALELAGNGIAAALQQQHIIERTAAELSAQRAREAAREVEQARTRLQRSRRVTGALARLVGQLQQVQDLELLLPSMLLTCAHSVQASTAAVFLLNEDGESIKMQALVLDGRVVNMAVEPVASMWRTSIPLHGPAAAAWSQIAQAAPVWWMTLEHELLGEAARQWHEAQGSRFIAHMPLKNNEATVGFVALSFSQDPRADLDLPALLETLSQHVALALRASTLSGKLRETAILKERNRLARDIHDTLAQGFLGIILHLRAGTRLLGAAAQDGSSFSNLHDRIDSALRLAESNLAEARRSVRALLPPRLTDVSLTKALHGTLIDTFRGHDIQVDHIFDDSLPELPESMQATLLRVCQEAAANIVHHSRARSVVASLVRTNGDVLLSLTDDGVGFDVQKSSGGFGLRIMHERLRELGGQLDVSSAPGHGTRVQASIPMTAERTA